MKTNLFPLTDPGQARSLTLPRPAGLILALLAALGLCQEATAQFTAPNGYLPASGFSTRSTTNIIYQPNSQYTIAADNPAHPSIVGYNQVVQCPVQNIGTINFDYGITDRHLGSNRHGQCGRRGHCRPVYRCSRVRPAD